VTTNRLVQLMVAISVIVEEIFDYFLRLGSQSEPDDSDTSQDANS
jgi:hypothetical protein